jgi:ATP-binding protein involved in chromosome partitioning
MPSALPTTEQVTGLLRGVVDPELKDNIVDLGMVRSARVDDDGTVTVTIALTTAGCPLRATIRSDIEARLDTLPGVSAVRLEWDELNATEKARVMERARANARDTAAPTQVPARTQVFAVASGKGGVGKSSVTVNLAAELARRGHAVGVLDADIWGFSVPRMLGAEGRLEARRADGDDRGKIVPQRIPVGSGVLEVVSTGLLVDSEETALMWRGLMLAKAVEQFLHDVAWGDLDYLLIDMPPGTGDVQMALARLLPQAQMLVVTTPALSAQKVAVRVADMARRSHMPVAGVIENMAAFTTPDGQRWPLFGEGGGERLAAEIDAPLLGSIPLEPAVSAGGDAGAPVVLAGEGPAAAAISAIVDRVEADSPPVTMEGCTARMLAAVEAAFEPATT